MEGKNKFTYQNSLYDFPYHYLPSLEGGSVPRLHRQLTWGLDYLTYMSFVVEHISQYRPESLCDVGCGDGRLIHIVKDFVPKITGVDLSELAVAFARAFNPEVEILHEDIANIQQKYRMITLIETLEHIPDQYMAEFVSNLTRIICRNGSLLVTVPTVNFPLNKKHYRHYNLQTLQNDLSPHFEIKEHWWLSRYSHTTRLLTRLLCNRFYLLNYSPALKLIWKIHKRFNFHVDSSTGAHLVCVAELA